MQNSAARASYGIAIALLLLAALRFTFLYFDFGSLADDPDSYALLAVNLSNSGTFGIASQDGSIQATAYRPPAYPWLLSWLVFDGKLSLVAVGVLQVAISLACALLVLAIGSMLEVRYASVAALALAVDPLMLRQSQLVMTETIAALCVLLGWWLWLRVVALGNAVQPDSDFGLSADSSRRSDFVFSGWARVLRLGRVNASGSTQGVPLPQLLTLGVVLGGSVLVRPTLAPWAVMCLIAASWYSSRVTIIRLRTLAVASACVMLFVVPWTVRNYAYLGKAIWATSHGGYTLLLANNPLLFEHFSEKGPARSWDAEPFHLAWRNREVGFADASPIDAVSARYWRGPWQSTAFPQTLGELPDDRLAYELAVSCIRSNPVTFLQACFYRVAWFWAWWPYGVDWYSTVLIGCWYGFWMVAALRGATSLWANASVKLWLPAIFIVLTLTAIHAVYWSNMRMRTPLMGPVYLLAINGIGLQLRNRDMDSGGGAAG